MIFNTRKKPFLKINSRCRSKQYRNNVYASDSFAKQFFDTENTPNQNENDFFEQASSCSGLVLQQDTEYTYQGQEKVKAEEDRPEEYKKANKEFKNSFRENEIIL